MPDTKADIEAEWQEKLRRYRESDGATWYRTQDGQLRPRSDVRWTNRRGLDLIAFAVVAFLVIAVLAGCAQLTQQAPLSPAAKLLITCETYADTLDALAVQRELGNLSSVTINRVDKARAVLNPVCLGPTPTSTDGEELSVSSALYRAEAALAVLVSAKEEADGSR